MSSIVNHLYCANRHLWNRLSEPSLLGSCCWGEPSNKVPADCIIGRLIADGWPSITGESVVRPVVATGQELRWGNEGYRALDGCDAQPEGVGAFLFLQHAVTRLRQRQRHGLCRTSS